MSMITTERLKPHSSPCFNPSGQILFEYLIASQLITKRQPAVRDQVNAAKVEQDAECTYPGRTLCFRPKISILRPPGHIRSMSPYASSGLRLVSRTSDTMVSVSSPRFAHEGNLRLPSASTCVLIPTSICSLVWLSQWPVRPVRMTRCSCGDERLVFAETVRGKAILDWSLPRRPHLSACNPIHGGIHGLPPSHAPLPRGTVILRLGAWEWALRASRRRS